MTKTDQFENIEKHKKRSNKLRPKRNTDGLEWRGLTRILNDCKIFSFVTERDTKEMIINQEGKRMEDMNTDRKGKVDQLGLTL